MTELQDDTPGNIYEIKLKGCLDQSWADWFEGLTFTDEGDGTTTIVGEIVHQAALHSLLKKVRNLGLPLLAVNRRDPPLTKCST